MVAMETGNFLKMLNDASLASIGFLMWKVVGCIICKNCWYSPARLTPSATIENLVSLSMDNYRDNDNVNNNVA